MSAVVEADEKGRILIPAEVRRRYGSNRFKVTVKDDHMELEFKFKATTFVAMNT